MTPLARRASLLVGFSLLTSAATAYAECAWVMWMDIRGDGLSSIYRVVQARATRQECEDALRDLAKSVSGAQYHGTGTLNMPTGGIIYLCLPDTIDPRGPKGK